jgi:hypothetical protein
MIKVIYYVKKSINCLIILNFIYENSNQCREIKNQKHQVMKSKKVVTKFIYIYIYIELKCTPNYRTIFNFHIE